MLTNSGTAAITLALRASAPSGDPIVALPAYACPDLGSAAVGAGFGILLYDIDAETFEPDLDGVARCIASGATHVLVAHLAGHIVDVARVARLTDGAGVVLIEDAAQHAGGSRGGKRAGALADWSVLSFGRGKGLNAGGGGALLRSRSSNAPWKLPPLRKTPSRWNQLVGVMSIAATDVLANPSLYWLPASVPMLHLGETRYHEPLPPGAMPAVFAQLLAHALWSERHQLSVRRANEAWYTSALSALKYVRLVRRAADSESGALRFPVLLPSGAASVLAPLGVTRMYPRTLDEYAPIRAALVHQATALPGSELLAAQLHSLPTHSLLTVGERERIVQALTDAEQ